MYFCLNCISGKEESVKTLSEKFLNEHSDYGHEIFFPKKEMSEKRNGVRETVQRPMFPGYLFIFWEDEKEESFPFREIAKIPGAVKFLRYDDKSHELKGNDNSLVTWLHDNKGLIAQSKVILEPGKKLHIVQGPLEGFDGQVVKVDRHHKLVTLKFDVAGITNDVTFSVEFIEQNSAVNSLLSQR